jgi:protein-tyrosine phosphatase
MPKRFLVVCLGNICRSPIAKGLLSLKLPKATFIVDSCGTGNWPIGNQPDLRSISVSKKMD